MEFSTLRIVNNSSDTVLVTVFPKSKYSLTEDLYYGRIERTDVSWYTKTKLKPEGRMALILYTEQANIDPVKVINEVFDSVRISLVERDLNILFSIDNVINYSKNIFVEESIWEEKYTESISEIHFPFSPKTLEKETRYIFTLNDNEILSELEIY